MKKIIKNLVKIKIKITSLPKKYLILAGILVLVVILGIILALILIKPKSKSTNISPLTNSNINPNLSQTATQSAEIPTSNDQLAILLLGYGGAGHDGGYLTDAMQIFYADFTKNKLALVSIPRDLWVTLPNNTQEKINAAYVSGASTNTGSQIVKNIVTQVTGIPINFFAAVDFVGFQRAVGQNLGGIQVNVAETLDDPWYPIKGEEQNTCGKTPEEVAKLSQELSGFELEKQFTCRYEHLHFEKGVNNMQGGEAMKYVRSRHGSSDGDISRGRRQQEVLQAIAQKMVSLNALNDINSFFKIVSKNIQTDIDEKILDFFAPMIKKTPSMKLIRINLSTTNVLKDATANTGAAILIPKDGMFQWKQIQTFIQDELNKN